MGVGDEILAAGMAQKIWEADPRRRVVIVDRVGRARWHEIWEGNPIIVKPTEMARAQARQEQFHRLTNASGCRPYIRYPFTQQTGWRFNTGFRARNYIAKLYLTPHEINRGKKARMRYGPYVLIEPYTRHTNFLWPLERWNQLVAACPDVTFVQHTHRWSPRVIGAQYEEASFRDACGVLASARAYMRSESGLVHAAAALGIPAVTFFGGCMDPEVMGGYPFQVSLVDTGPGSPCGRWLPCAHCAGVMKRITVEHAIAALRESLRRREQAA